MDVFFKSKNYIRTKTHLELLGCDVETLKKHFESKFRDGMTLENHGEWQVDHIIPISKINFDDETSINKILNYTNLQPLWKEENKIKYNKILDENELEKIKINKKFINQIKNDDFDFID
jgi:5-methylcytosine-specific restriction endonuclease McrA